MHGKSREKQIRHMEDMHRLALIYNNEYERCQKEELPKSVLKNVKSRINLCVQSVILDLILIAKDKKEVKEKLNQLKKDRLYPYPLTWWQLFDKNIQSSFKAKVLSFFFPIRPYVLLVSSFFRKRNKK